MLHMVLLQRRKEMLIYITAEATLRQIPFQLGSERFPMCHIPKCPKITPATLLVAAAPLTSATP